MTNYEKIKAMSVEEMANFFYSFFWEENICSSMSDCVCNENCHDCAIKYLQQESEDDEE